ncbi:MAG: gliding motility-associated C-terminal domain-containing protein [Bacteroidales bacterium]|nr:gliding motility-associated C-terminal domain-containing protein [Bacteroidales bacterium]
MKIILTIVFTAVFFFLQLSLTSGQINHYLKVLEVQDDRVKVEKIDTIDLFDPGCKVLLIQMTGALKADDDEPDQTGFFSALMNCGKFEILQVAEIQKGTDYFVLFTDSIYNTYTDGEKIQLVRMWEDEKVVVNSTITAKEWDGNKGGIVAIIGLDTIELRSDIDVSSNGFRGGQPELIVPNNCRTVADSVNWKASEPGSAGHKGEGIITVNSPYTMGSANALNGGGGGNGKYAGGGGGSNYDDGGTGGAQYNACTYVDNYKAEGGFGQRDYNDTLFYHPLLRRIMMGGGGGSGTQDPSLNRYATAGGDGGGIILLITERLIGNGGVLRANGQSVTGTASASGGGGGGGGTVLIDAAAYSGSFLVEVKGGDGGSTLTNCTGAGGAGSGGVLWYSGASLYPGITLDASAGARGQADLLECGGGNQFGGMGNPGASKPSLLLILNGFLFNVIHGIDTICAGQTPGMLTGSNPKGGDGNYTFAWRQSLNGSVWEPAAGINNGKNYQPPALTQSTFYQRVVTSEGIIDYSLPRRIHVYNAIGGNTITGTDTICYDVDAKPLTGTTPPTLTGGDSSYTYQWHYSTNGTDWNNIETGGTSHNYDPGRLTTDRYYRRYVESHSVCTSISNVVTITVLDTISSNRFYSGDTTICQTLSPGTLNIKAPGGGDNTYRFAWLMKPASGSWSQISGANNAVYNPGSLNETTLFRRIVYSGNGDACIDTSIVKTVTVLDSISDNRISIDPSKYCAGDVPGQIDGLLPGGGDAGNYIYQWQVKTNGVWNNISGAKAEDYTPFMVENDTCFRRIVSSGSLPVTGKYACNDTSSFIELEVVPYIINRLNLADQTLCQHNTPLPLNPDQPVSGGYGSFTYQWKINESPATEWDNAPGASTSPNYEPGTLETTTLFTRIVESDICEQISDTVTVTVYPVISNNNIIGGSIQYTCFNTGKTLNGSTPLNGKAGDYAYLWQKSTDGSAWEEATGKSVNTQISFETPDLTDTMLYRRIVYSSAALKECSDISEPVTIRINPLPSGDIISSVDKVCGGDTLYVSFNVSGGSGPYEISVRYDDEIWSKPGVMVLYDSIPIDFNNVQNSYNIRMKSIQDDSSCLADPTGFSNTAVANVYAVPDADAGPGGEVCGPQYTLLNTAELLPSFQGLWTTPHGYFDNDTVTATNVTIDTNFYGKNYMKWTVYNRDNRNCSNWDTAGVMFYEPPRYAYAGGPYIVDTFQYTMQLNADPPEAGTGHWTVVEGTGIISDDTLYNATITELSARNLIRWTVINGICPEKKDSVEIIIKMLAINKGFSPNGDGINDEFKIPTENAERIAIKIFNRAGILVFESDNYTEGEPWKGTGKNNLDLPEGTYFYIMDIWVRGKTEPVNFKSFVEILR